MPMTSVSLLLYITVKQFFIHQTHIPSTKTTETIIPKFQAWIMNAVWQHHIYKGNNYASPALMNLPEFLSNFKFMPVCLPTCFWDLTIHSLNFFQCSTHIHSLTETLRSEGTISFIIGLEISKVLPDCQNGFIFSLFILRIKFL